MLKDVRWFLDTCNGTRVEFRGAFRMHSTELPMDSLQERSEVLKKTNVAVQETELNVKK